MRLSFVIQNDPAGETEVLDREIGFDGAGFGGSVEVEEDDDDFALLEPEEESQFSISRSIRSSTASQISTVDPVRPSLHFSRESCEADNLFFFWQSDDMAE